LLAKLRSAGRVTAPVATAFLLEGSLLKTGEP
jgi:hypothetical protein